MNAPRNILCDHDVAPGPLKRCQITGSENLNLVLDLGHQPPCDTLLTAADLDRPEVTYPLRLMHCPDSGLAQLDFAVPGELLYPPEYPYRAGISWPLVEHHKELARTVMGRMGFLGEPFVVDIGSNDGTLLKEFKALGAQVLGVEPTDVAQIAVGENQVPTVQSFFTEVVAGELARERRADVITATNVFAHMAPLGEVMRGICALLADSGVLVIEAHYLANIIAGNQFDTIYHEHLRTYSLKALCLLFPQYGLEVFHAELTNRYGGDLRVWVGWKDKHPVTGDVGAMLAEEESSGLHKPETWAAWKSRVVNCRDVFMSYLYEAKREGKRIAGVSSPGRCSTLLNWYGIGPDMIEYLGELPDSLKLGKFSPGRHIPIVSNKRFSEDNPDILVLMAWHYGKQIVQRLRAEGLKQPIVYPLPTVQVV